MNLFPNKNIVSLGVLPNGIFPVCQCPDSLYLYYREDGHLYFYSCSKAHEWDLTLLEANQVDPTPDVSTLYKIYFGISNVEINAGNAATQLVAHNIYLNTAVKAILDGSSIAIEGYSHLLVPNLKEFSILQTSIEINGQYSKVGTLTLSGVLYDIYKDSTLTYIDELSTYYIRLK